VLHQPLEVPLLPSNGSVVIVSILYLQTLLNFGRHLLHGLMVP
jgi:hypothetical protein